MSVSAPHGSDAFTITLFDAGAHPLSTNSETVTIVAGQTTTAQPLFLGGIAATYQITAAGDAATAAHVLARTGGGYTIIGDGAYAFTFQPVDASGAIITGPGAPSVTVTSSSAGIVPRPSAVRRILIRSATLARPARR